MEKFESTSEYKEVVFYQIHVDYLVIIMDFCDFMKLYEEGIICNIFNPGFINKEILTVVEVKMKRIFESIPIEYQEILLHMYENNLDLITNKQVAEFMVFDLFPAYKKNFKGQIH